MTSAWGERGDVVRMTAPTLAPGWPTGAAMDVAQSLADGRRDYAEQVVVALKARERAVSATPMYYLAG